MEKRWMVVACHKEEKAGKICLASWEDKVEKSLDFLDDKVCVSMECQIGSWSLAYMSGLVWLHSATKW